MSAVFLKVLNMSITASWLILAVILTRLILKKAPKWISCLLWGLVAIRLMCPFSFESVLSLIPSSETIPANIAQQHEPAVTSGITIVNEAVNPVIAESFTPAPTDSANPLQIVIPVAAIIWAAGIMIMLAYALISYLKLKKTLSVCVPVGERILACDEVKAPFILGVFRPIIYVPSSMSGKTLEHVICHEKAHLRRHDHWWKPLGFLLLSVYWFNPLCWVAYILLCRDIELACDEKVIRDMDRDDIAAYSQALLDCSFPRRRIAACPLAFGEVGVKERVKGVLNYKKPAFWVVTAAVIACVAIGVCFLTSPKAEKAETDSITYVHRDTAVGQRADFDVDIGRSVLNAELTAEMWQNGQCTSGGSVVITAQTEKITLIFSDRRDNQNLVGEDIQIDIDDTVGTLVTYFAFPERIAGWSFTSWQDTVDIPVQAGEDVILAAMTGDMGSGVRSFDCQSLSSEPDRLTSAECMIVVRAQFYDTDVPVPVESDTPTEHRLTLDDVRSLSQKGYALSWDDFADYKGAEIGSDRHIMQYIIDDDFDLLVGGDSTGEKPLYISLRNYVINAWVDIRDNNVDEFISLHKDEMDMESLRSKYPQYFDLNTSKGLEVYVWQMAQGSYICGVLPGTNREKSIEELMNLQGVTIGKMRAILSAYDIEKEDVIIIPWQNPLSSYLGDYWVSYEGEDPNEVEKRRQDYLDVIRQMLFGDESSEYMIGKLTEYSRDVIDIASLDIDNDGVYEDCTMTYGPTSGLFTVTITASVDGSIKYGNTFSLNYGNTSKFNRSSVSFAEKDGEAYFVRDDEYHRLYVEDNRIVIEGLDPQYEGYWGDSQG